MTEYRKIDDPVDASFETWPAEPESVGDQFRELALTFGGVVFPPIELFKILRDQFSTSRRFARIEYLFQAVRMKLQILESQIGEAREQMRAAQEKFESLPFHEAASVACEEAVRATSLDKIDQFAAVLVGPLTRNAWADPNEDIGVLIRDIAQLGKKDLDVLAILRSVHASAISTSPNLNDSDAFSRETPSLRRAVASWGIHPDDFLSACERLRGFGLAADVVRNTGHMAPNDYCYRPTRRGLAVLSYLSAASDENTAGAEAAK